MAMGWLASAYRAPRIAEPLKALIAKDQGFGLAFADVKLDVDVVGPIAGNRLDSELLEKLIQFRKENADHQFLVNDYQLELERRLKIDERSFHFIAIQDGQIRGALRATPGPFELSALTPELASVADGYDQYLEVSRMVLDAEGRKGWLGLLLCYAVVRWGSTSKWDGMIALCRRANANRFSFLGFQSRGHREFVVPQRENGLYSFMASPWSDFVSRLEMLFGPAVVSTFDLDSSFMSSSNGDASCIQT